MKKFVYLATDHGAFELKESLKVYLSQKGYEFEDLGVHSPESVDYPNIAKELCEKVLARPDSLGVLMCGTGIGVSIAANRFKGIRAVDAVSEYMARMAREHNHANVLCLGGRMVGLGLAQSIVDAFLAAEPDMNERHVRRVGEMDNL